MGHDILKSDSLFYIDNIDKNVKIEVFHPSVDFFNEIQNIDSENDLSIVLKITYKEISFLLTGDIEKDTEKYLLNSDYNLKSTVLKVAHHGSRTSSTRKFLENVNPEISVISAGFNNRFNHPNKKVIKRLENLDTKIFRTDERGAITITTDGEKYWIDTFINIREY